MVNNAVVVRIEKGHDHFDIRKFGERQTREQTGHAALGGLYPEKMIFNLSDDQMQAYPVGEYLIDPRSYRIGKYSKLELNPFELRLIPIGTRASSVAA